MMVSEEVHQSNAVSSTKKDPTENILETLILWFQKHHIWFDEESIEIVQDVCQPLPPLKISGVQIGIIPIHTRGISFSIKAKKNISNDAIVCKIPKNATLTWRTGGISNILEDEEIMGTLSLVITLMYEVQQGANSPWFGYLQTLPEYVPLPCMWSEDELFPLTPTNSYTKAVETKSDLKEDFSEVIEPLASKYPEIFQSNFFTLDNFFRASSLVSSRAFLLDDYHGDAMVPLADLFNHRSGLEHVHFESVGDVCSECGEHEGCIHQAGAVSEDEPSCESGSDGSDTSSPGSEPCSSPPCGLDINTFKEYDSDSIDQAPSKKECPLTGLGNENECFDCDLVSTNQDTIVEMRMVREASIGDEIFNTYGQKSNEVLLEKYGFAELDNVDNFVFFAKEDVLEACADLANLESDEVDLRFNFWIQCWKILSRSLAEEEDGDEPVDEDEEGCFFCGLVHGSDNSDESDLDILTCPFSQEGPRQGEDEAGYHRLRMERNQIFNNLVPHLFRLSHPGIPAPSFLTFLHVMFMTSEVISKLKDSESSSIIIEYFSLVFDSWASHTADFSDESTSEPSPKRFKSDPDSADFPVSFSEGVPTPDDSIPDSIIETLQYLIQPRLQAFQIDSSIDEDRIEVEKLLRSPETNPRIRYAKIARYSERLLLETCSTSLSIQN